MIFYHNSIVVTCMMVDYTGVVNHHGTVDMYLCVLIGILHIYICVCIDCLCSFSATF